MQRDVDSTGIGNWHVGSLPDKRMRRHGAARGLRIDHVARQIDASSDFRKFDYIIVMDEDNYRTVTAMAHNESDRKKVIKMADYLKKHPKSTSVPDPYYGGDADFEWALDLIEDGCDNLLQALTKEEGA